MLQLNGDFYDGTGSKQTKVELSLNDEGLLTLVAADGGDTLQQLNQQQVDISSRLANSPRYLNLPGDQVVETLDNDAVDLWLQQFRSSGMPGLFGGLVHRLESNLSFVALTLLTVILVVWGTARYGVPATAHAIAKALPPELLDRASNETLQLLDQHWLQPSTLSGERKDQLQQHFSEAVTSHQNLRVQVLFRNGEAMGPNAFALPSGQIIFTDQIIELAQHDDELLAILGHEIGHIEYRHSQRRIIQNSLLIFLLAMITGDVSGTSEVVLGLPVLFAELAYSRANESEADQYALAFMHSRNIAPHRFSDLMLRLEDSINSKENVKIITGQTKPDTTDDTATEVRSWQRYLSTHPLTAERIKQFSP